MNRILPIFALVLCASIVAGLSSSAVAASAPEVPGRVVVSFAPGVKLAVDKSGGVPHTGLTDLDAVLDRHGAQTLEPLFGTMADAFADPAVRADLARHYILTHADKSGNDALNSELRQLRMVETSESDRVLPTHGTAYLPNDLAGPQWHLRNVSLGGADVRALGGWAESLGDSNVVVAVLDTGVDWHHPDLGGPHPDKVNGAIWTNWTEYYGTAGVDDDGNGFIDDVRGWDFVNVSAAQVWPGEDYGPPDADPMDFDGHGTLVSGCIAPITGNGIGVAALAPGCKIMAVRIGWHTTDGNGVAYASYMAQAFVYATANGADIINLSYGTSYLASFASAINAALNAGLVICVSAGNDNNDEAGYLQSYPDDRVLTVAASNSNDGKADFSSFGTWVDVTAPGKNIYTTAYSFQSGQSTYSSTQGTSFSSPITAGACALVWSALPQLTSSQLAALIQDTCDPIDQLNPGYEGLLGHGRINVLRALGDSVQLVPQEFASIADAINEATPGDVIKVLASQVLAPFSVVGKGLTIEGGHAAGYTSRDPIGSPTLIQASAVSPALEFFGTVTNATVVDGFRLQGGGGRTFSDIPYPGRYGGAVVVTNQSPTLRNLIITGSSVGSASQLGCGGGVLLYNSQAVLEDITISGNTAALGAGAFIYQGSPTLTRVVIDANLPFAGNLANPPRGGGLCILDADVTLNDVAVSGHVGLDQGGGLYVGQVNGESSLTMTGGAISGNTAKTSGGGLCATGTGTIDLMDVVIENNGPTPAATFMSGGAIYASGVGVTLDGCTVTDNSAQGAGGIQLVGAPTVDLSSSLFTGNTSLIFGGTVYLVDAAAADLAGLTIAGNSSVTGGAGINATNSALTVSNTISAFNTGGATANGINVAGGSAALSCNDIFGNAGANYGGVTDPTGTAGNVSLDPLFCDAAGGDYRVSADGPCAPAQSGCGLIGAREASCGTATGVESADVPVAFAVEPCFPNPFNPVTTIRFAIPTAARTTVTVFDVLGRRVTTCWMLTSHRPCTRCNGGDRMRPADRRPPASISTRCGAPTTGPSGGWPSSSRGLWSRSTPAPE
ncbi:MAG: S8 family serine peptidase [Candidatus Krumholzibacteriia bacterium]